jgi:hypothetical protein
MKRAQPLVDDELQMRAFWRQWHTLMLRDQPTEVARPHAVAV